MNILLAFFIFLGINLDTASRSRPSASPRSRTASSPHRGMRRPAGQAGGHRGGDTVVALNGTSVTTWRDLVVLVRAQGEGPLAFTVDRPGRGA